MHLVLTYHRVIPDSAPITEFFDVTAGELDQQLEATSRMWSCMPHNGTDLFAKETGMSGRAGPVVITFDDGTTDHYETAAPLLENHGMRGIFYISTDCIGKPGHLTLDQCIDLARRGHAIESHGHVHEPMTLMDRDERLRQFRLSRQILQSNGLGKIGSIAAVGGFWNPEVLEDASTAGFSSLRSLQWGYNSAPRFLWDSINVNRMVSTRYFNLMINPRHSWLKSAIYSTKEGMKNSKFAKIYFHLTKRATQSKNG